MNINTKDGMAQAVAWQQKWVDGVKEGGVWVVPRSGNIIRISHRNRTATVVSSLVSEPDIRKVFEEMGWRYVDPAMELSIL
jgi:hypothetical protein